MPYKRFYKKAGYEATLSLFMAGKQFIKGIGSSNKLQMFELLSQFKICELSLGFDHKYCYGNYCMGVPVCDPNFTRDETKLRTNLQ